MHIAITPDGNRRYSKKKVMNFKDAYAIGMNKFRDFIEWCSETDVECITAYALSLENIRNRSAAELEILNKVLIKEIDKTINDERIHKNNVCVRICGNLNAIKSKKFIEKLKELEDVTAKYSKHRVNLAVAYGGRQEIMEVIEKFKNSNEEVNEENVRNKLLIKEYPDIFIRTGAHRISNFLLWQVAYSEIYFVDKLWPELEKDDLIKIISDYNKTKRNFGK
ncbi:Tritrans,polycis-undecaprenyl-diphosphate synthase (geranylgeranyl-diphosphate specific) [groundwater metagenome]|uniref:Tritrans,polycis-undecaprenyl-diphosphate synthase (Geranylgeranyl-diphosphate specific) n=1 Tax=groundwater metagenome TaxID=717931 RepID=A0A098E758_9ZZZZ